MSLGLYMDEHVHSAITDALRRRGVDVLTVQEDGHGGADDPDVLDRATALGRVVVTQDEDFLRESAARQRSGATFGGVVYAHQVRVPIGQCVTDLEAIALVSDPAEYLNRVEYLPL